MSRTFRQTTAIAAMIAVAAPQMGLAQSRIPLDAIPGHRTTTEAAHPDQAATLAAELAAGLAVDGLTCSDGGAVPDCALVTPEGVAVVLGEDDSILLAPDGAPEPAPEAAAEPDAAPAADTAAQTPAPEADAPAADATQAAPVEAAPEQAASDATAPEAAAQSQEATEPQTATDEPAAAGESPAPTSQAADSAPAESAPDAAAAQDPDGAADDAGDAVTTDTTTADSGADTAAKADDTTAVTTLPVMPGEDAVPDTAVNPDADALAELLAKEGEGADTAAEPADEATDFEAPPEARAVEPDEAATLAAEAEAPVAAALDVADDSATEGEAITVTEGTARSSAEDFATSVSAATKATQEAAPSDDHTKRDLARALLAGLAGYAVGQAVGDHGQVALNSGDRVVITRQDGSQQVLKDDSALMFQPGSQVQTQNFEDGSSRIVVTREDGSRVVTIRDANLRVLRRTLINQDGSEVRLIDDTAPVEPVKVAELPPPAKPLPAPSLTDEAALRRALETTANRTRRFTLGQVRDIAGVRALVAPVNIEGITFDTGSAAIKPDQARQLASLGAVIADYVRRDPGEIFLVEGYTDTVGADAMNLALSDRRAESLALALTEYFGVPPENLVVQGYGERFLKVPAEGDIRENRRVAVRRITDLLARN